MYRPPLLLTITPSTGILRRYEGRRCTDAAQMMEPLNRTHLDALYRFMFYPERAADDELEAPRIA